MEGEGKSFRDLQEDQRVNPLERNLNLTGLQRPNTFPLPASANISISGVSSIHSDKPFSDLTRFGTAVRSSGASSIVLASSNNFRRRLSKNLNTDLNITPGASSVLQQSSENRRINEGEASMPLPPALTRCKTRSLYKSKQKRQAITSSPKTSFSHGFVNQMRDGPSVQRTSRMDRTASVKTKAHHNTRVFRNWIVRLNDSGQIIIRGRLESGETARSKAVKKRLSPTTMLSVFNCRYYLLGDIYDVQKKLPEYVREKFHNGFPVDWESVRQVWQEYVAAGSSSQFRWPRPITDSDDDIQSDITDLTVSNPNTFLPKSASYVSIPGPSQTVEGAERSAEKQNIRSQRKEMPQDPGSIATRDYEAEARTSARESSWETIEEENGAKVDGPLVNQNQSTNRNTRFNEIHRQESPGFQNVIPKWKVDIIVDNLINKNYSSECIDKIVMAINCVNELFAMPATNNIDTSPGEAV